MGGIIDERVTNLEDPDEMTIEITMGGGATRAGMNYLMTALLLHPADRRLGPRMVTHICHLKSIRRKRKASKCRELFTSSTSSIH
jgi:hypothetical protein